VNFEFCGTRVDATGFATREQAERDLETLTRIPCQNNMVAVIVKPWEVNVSTANPHGHGWGVPGHRVYAVARYVAVPKEDNFDTGKILLAYRRQLRAAIKAESIEGAANYAREEIKRIEPVLFGLGLGFER